MVIITHSDKETISLGKRFFSFLEDKDLVLLEGDLGGGKTTFTKGILRGANFHKRVLSPSFTLLRQYHIKKGVVNHLDLYRLKAEETFGFGLEDYLYEPGSITLIEWGEKIEHLVPKYIKIKFLFVGQDTRRIHFSIKGYGASRNNSLKEILGSEFARN